MSDKNNFKELHPRDLYYTGDNLRELHGRPNYENFEWQVSSHKEATEKTVICRDPEQGRVLFRSILPTNLREAMLMGYILGKSAGYFEDESMWHYIMNQNEEYRRAGYGSYDPDMPPISEDEDKFKDQFTQVAPPYWPEDDKPALAEAAE